MNPKFVSLLMDHPADEPPGETQKEAARLLSIRIDESPLHYWRPGDFVPLIGQRILIGIASYSVLDLYFLDVLVDSVAREVFWNIRFDVFDVLDCKKMEDFELYFPNIGPVTNTPIAGFWRDGSVEEIVRHGSVYKRIADIFKFQFDVDKSPERVGMRKLGLL